MRPRSRLWWYRRFRRAYRLHGVLPYSRRRTWDDARVARRSMPAARQRQLPPVTGPGYSQRSGGTVQP